MLQAGLHIDVPVLVATSARSYWGKFSEAAHHADAVLNVAHIARYAPGLGKDVTLVRIDGGKHDLTLSPAKARAELFATLDEWLRVTPTLGVATALGSRGTARAASAQRRNQREENRARGLAFHSGRLADCSGAQPHDAGYSGRDSAEPWSV